MGQYEDRWLQSHIKDQLLLHTSSSNIQQYEYLNNNLLDLFQWRLHFVSRTFCIVLDKWRRHLEWRMSGNNFLKAYIRPLSLSDIKNVIEFVNSAFWKCLRKYDQFSSSSLGTKPWATINIVTLESWFLAIINIPLNFPDKLHAAKHAVFAYGTTFFVLANW